jgi:hypothetical protein
VSRYVAFPAVFRVKRDKANPPHLRGISAYSRQPTLEQGLGIQRVRQLGLVKIVGRLVGGTGRNRRTRASAGM